MAFRFNMTRPFGHRTVRMLRRKRLLPVGAVCAILPALLLFPACASIQLPRVAPVPVDQFEAFSLPNSGAITPASALRGVADVDILELSGEMKALVDASVTPFTDPTKRLSALATILSKKVRYDTAADRYGIKTAKETFETGTGNCLSFSNMFIAMARHAGLNAQYQEIPTPPHWTRNGEVLFFTLHIGAFVDILNRNNFTIQIGAGEREVIRLWNTTTRYMFTPSELGLYNPDADPLSAHPIPDRRALAQYYNNIGAMHMADGENREAFRFFVKALHIDPRLNFVWSNLGVAYSRNDQLEAAEEAYQQGLSVSRRPDDVNVMTIMSNMAKLYRRTGNGEKAEYFEKEVASFRQRNPYYHYALAKTAFFEAQYGESVRHFKDAITKKDDEHLFYYGLALAYYKLGDLKNMDKNLDKAKQYVWDVDKKDYYDQVREKLAGDARQ